MKDQPEAPQTPEDVIREEVESLRRDIIGMVVNGFAGSGQYKPMIRGGVSGLTAEHLREWDSRLGAVLSLLQQARTEKDKEPPHCGRCDQPVLDNGDIVCVDCAEQARTSQEQGPPRADTPR